MPRLPFEKNVVGQFLADLASTSLFSNKLRNPSIRASYVVIWIFVCGDPTNDPAVPCAAEF